MIPFSLPGQAWLFPKGEGTVTLSYQNTLVQDHVDYKGQPWSLFGDINSQSITVDTDYSLTNKLAVRVALPYVFGRYDGPSQYAHSFPADDGKYHSTFQNFTADLRYNVSQRPVVLTPFVRLVVPSHDYQYFAHAAVGRDVREYHIGINVGRRLDPILPKAFVQVQYSYAFVERILNISPNRSNVEAQLGYFLTPRLSLLASTQWYYTYNGIEDHFDIPPPGGLTRRTISSPRPDWKSQFTRRYRWRILRHESKDGNVRLLRTVALRYEWPLARCRGNHRSEPHIWHTHKEESASSASGMPPPNQAIVCTCARGN